MRVLYLHGFASGPSSHKARFFERCFEEHGSRLEVLDLVEGDFEQLTITSQLAVIERTARNEPVSLIGSSMGGYLAALYARRHPEVAKLVLLAPAFCFATRWPQSLGEQEMRKWKTTGYRRVFHYGENRERLLRYQIIEDGLQYEDFPQFTQPAFIVHGRSDEIVPSAFSVEFAATRPNVKLLLVDSGHELVDVVEMIWNETRDFLRVNTA